MVCAALELIGVVCGVCSIGVVVSACMAKYHCKLHLLFCNLNTVSHLSWYLGMRGVILVFVGWVGWRKEVLRAYLLLFNVLWERY